MDSGHDGGWIRLRFHAAIFDHGTIRRRGTAIDRARGLAGSEPRHGARPTTFACNRRTRARSHAHAMDRRVGAPRAQARHIKGHPSGAQLERISFNLIYKCAARCGLSKGNDLGALPPPSRDRLLTEGWGEGHTSTSHDSERAAPYSLRSRPRIESGSKLSPPQTERSAGASPCNHDRRQSLAR